MIFLPIPKEMILADGYHLLIPETRMVLDTSCDFADMNTALLLREQILELTGIRLDITKETIDSETKGITLKKEAGRSQAYYLDILPERIEILGSESAGLFYGCQTLRQSIAQSGVELPCIKIVDWPEFENRGFYHDVTRGKVPKLDTLKELADRASYYKINQLQLYVEHTFAFKNIREAWLGADPLTAEEVLLFDKYCAERSIELVPSLSTFGHLYHLLSSDSFRELCELEVKEDSPFSWRDRMAHHTIDVSNPAGIELIKSMIDEFVPLFSSGKFNICCDETFDLGQGKNKELAEKIGVGRLYVDFLKKIIEHVKAHGKHVMFWGDIILKHPECLSEIPEDVTCLNWCYSADVPENTIEEIAHSGIPQYLCPGVQGWNMLMNDMDTAFSNISQMIGYGEKYRAIGILNTDWGDYGHINLFANSMSGMILGAALSWNFCELGGADNFDMAVSRMEYKDKTGKLMGLLRRLARQQIFGWCDFVHWKEDPYSRELMEKLSDYSADTLMGAYLNAIEIQNELNKMRGTLASKRNDDLSEFCLSAEGIALMQAFCLALKKFQFGQQLEDIMLSPVKLADRMEQWLILFSRAWRNRNKESELYRIRDAIAQACKVLRKIDQ